MNEQAFAALFALIKDRKSSFRIFLLPVSVPPWLKKLSGHFSDDLLTIS